MLIGRFAELNKVEQALKRQKSTIVLGIKGIGKTALLEEIAKRHKSVFVEYGSLKQILQALVKHFCLEFNSKYATIPEMLQAVKPLIKKHKPLIIIDDMDYIGKPSCRTLEKLTYLGATILGAAEKKPKFDFKETINLKQLSRQHSKMLAFKLLKSYSNEELLNLIATKSEGIPQKIVEICQDYKIGFKYLDFNPLDRKSVHKFIAGIVPKIAQRVNILPVWLLFVLGFTALTIKVFLFDKGDWKDAYIVAAFGYASLAIWKIFQETRRE